MRPGDFLKDESGKASMGRLLMALIIVAYLVFIAVKLYYSKGLTVDDIPGGVVAVVSLLYGASRASSAYQNRCVDPVGQPLTPKAPTMPGG